MIAFVSCVLSSGKKDTDSKKNLSIESNQITGAQPEQGTKTRGIPRDSCRYLPI